MNNDKILVLDFGSQYAHLITKRLRLLGYYSEIALPSQPTDTFKDVRGIILSGGPSSVYGKNIPEFNSEILNLNIPILALCYGHHLMAKEYGGKIEKSAVAELGITPLFNTNNAGTLLPQSPLLDGVKFPTHVWMSHQEEVTTPPEGFQVIARTHHCPNAALEDPKRQRWSLQYHIEVKDTTQGDRILANFAQICAMKKNWSQDHVLQTITKEIHTQAGTERKVLLFLSGGVDSTVTFALLNTVLGQERVLGLHINNGFMRKDESAIIAQRYREAGFTNFIVEDASPTFLAAVAGLVDPQKKRMAVGETYITVRDTVVARLGLNEEKWLLGQGTLYPDIIESGATKNSNLIKTHHNRVEGIQTLIEKGLIIEPLKNLYKDEVRLMGKKLGLSNELINRHPFPGPGLSINVLANKEINTDTATLKRARNQLGQINLTDSFTTCEGNTNTPPQANLPQLTAIDVLPVKSVGVENDSRTYRFPAVLRFANIFTAFPAWKELEGASTTITNASNEVNRTVLALWENPESLNGSTPLQLQEGYCDKNRLDQTREADAIVLHELKTSNWYQKIFQHLTINLPWATKAGNCSIVLRPVVSEDVMTAQFAQLDLHVLKHIVDQIAALPFVDAIYYDITNKPPATFGWE